MEKVLDKKILIVGDIMLDIYNFGMVQRISPEAPVPVFLEKGDIRYYPGGAANVAMNVAAIGAETDVFSFIGADDEGIKLEKLLKENGIGVSLLYKTQDRCTISKLRYIGQNNQQILRADKEDVLEFRHELLGRELKIIEENINDYAIFLLSDYNKGFLSEEFTQTIIRLANKYSIPVFVDVKGNNIDKYRNAMLLKPNKRELSILTNIDVDTKDGMIKASQYLCEKASCKYVLTTLGAEGMLLVNRDNTIIQIPSVAREVYDVTGAGDTSIAYLAVEFAMGKSIEEAVRISNIAAGIQVAKVGTGVVKRDEVYKKMNLARKNKVVFTNGCFDIIHSGHIAYLKEARSLGDKLIVGINTDASVKRLKGNGRPINNLEDRIEVLSSLSFVDEVIPFDEDTPLQLIKKIRPDVLVKGGDYKISEIVGAEEVISYGGQVRVLSFMRGKSTTRLIKKINEAY